MSKPWNAFWKDKNGQIVLFQRPNIWIIIWFVAIVINHFLANGDLKQTIHVAGTSSLVIWALLEIARGATYFRRLLGLIVLLWSVVSIFR